MCMSNKGYSIDIEGLHLPDVIKSSQNQDLVLNGTGVRKATLFRIRVYVACLYRAKKSSLIQDIANISDAQILQLHFVRAVSRDDIIDAWESGFRKNNDMTPELEAELKNLLAVTHDISIGDSIRLEFSNQGLTLTDNAGATFTSHNLNFAKALLQIWFGQYPPNEDMKSGLLGINE